MYIYTYIYICIYIYIFFFRTLHIRFIYSVIHSIMENEKYKKYGKNLFKKFEF